MRTQVRITERQNQIFITDIKDQTTVGYKYFRFDGADLLTLELRGHFVGNITASADEAGSSPIGEIELSLNTENWSLYVLPISLQLGDHPLYLHFAGEGTLDLKSIAFLAM